MTDDKKVVTLPTGYEPMSAPPNADDLAEIRWSLALIADEIQLLSRTVMNLTRALRTLNKRD